MIEIDITIIEIDIVSIYSGIKDYFDDISLAIKWQLWAFICCNNIGFLIPKSRRGLNSTVPSKWTKSHHQGGKSFVCTKSHRINCYSDGTKL